MDTSRLLVVPAWGATPAPWSDFADSWPGCVDQFLGPGVAGAAATADWSPEDDATDIAAQLDEETTLAAFGWAAEIGLRAAAKRHPRLVVLWRPGLGVNLTEVAVAAERDPKIALEWMRGIGYATEEYWKTAVQSPVFLPRALAYLRQDVDAWAAKVAAVPVLAGWPPSDPLPSALPHGWEAVAGDARSLATAAFARATRT